MISLHLFSSDVCFIRRTYPPSFFSVFTAFLARKAAGKLGVKLRCKENFFFLLIIVAIQNKVKTKTAMHSPQTFFIIIDAKHDGESKVWFWSFLFVYTAFFHFLFRLAPTSLHDRFSGGLDVDNGEGNDWEWTQWRWVSSFLQRYNSAVCSITIMYVPEVKKESSYVWNEGKRQSNLWTYWCRRMSLLKLNIFSLLYQNLERLNLWRGNTLDLEM